MVRLETINNAEEFDAQRARDCTAAERWFVLATLLSLLAYVMKYTFSTDIVVSIYPIIGGSVSIALRTYGLVRRRWSLSKWNIATYSTTALLIEMSFHIAMEKVVYCAVPDSIGSIFHGSTPDCSPGTHLNCWPELGRVHYSGGHAAELVMWLHVWYMVVCSITYRQSVLVATIIMFTFLSAFIANDASGLCESLFEIPWTIEGLLEGIFIVIAPFMAPFFVTMVCATGADRHRRLMDRTHQLLGQQAGAIIDEKLMRCSAEFACERFKAHTASGQSIDDESSAWSEAFPNTGPAAATLGAHHSAQPPTRRVGAPSLAETEPAMMLLSRNQSLGGCMQNGADCLPADAVAWVQHEPLPVALSAIKSGDKILCYDHLGDGLQYQEVASVSLTDAAADWVNVELEDGNSLSMTADHPCLQSAGGLASIPASKLLPEVHSITVLKMVPVRVKDVSAVDTSLSGEHAMSQGKYQRVTLNLLRPSRYSAFVASNGQSHPMAVGSSDAPDNTLVTANQQKIAFAGEECPARMARSQSDPGLLTAAKARTSTQSKRSKSTDTGSSDSSNTLRTSSLSSNASDVSDIAINVIGHTSQRARKACLSQILFMKGIGLPSVGSASHDPDLCANICRFQNLMQHGYKRNACQAGVLCEFCHCDHPKAQKRRGGLIAKARASRQAIQDG